jgi:hypothetical protein
LAQVVRQQQRLEQEIGVEMVYLHALTILSPLVVEVVELTVMDQTMVHQAVLEVVETELTP